MNDRIKAMAANVINHDTFPKPIAQKCLNDAELTDPIFIARGIQTFMQRQTVNVRQDEWIVDRYRFEQCDYPSDYYKRGGHVHTNMAWRVCCHASAPNDLYYWGWTHLALDYGAILTNGLHQSLAHIEEVKRLYADDAAKTRFLDGMTICLQSIGQRSMLYSDACNKLAAAAENQQDQDRYRAIACNCRKVPMNPAESFFEAIQSLWTMFLINPDSLGRIDQYLYPFFSREKTAGTLTDDHVIELLQELFIKVYESQVNNQALPISGHNHLVVGGYLQNGEDGYNELSSLIMEAIAELPTYRPQVSFRYTKKTTPATMRYVTELNRRCPLIVFVNDEPRIQGMIKAGIAREDAIEYTVVGCNEWAICGQSKIDLAHVNLVHSLTELLYHNTQRACAARDFDEFYSLFENSLHQDILRITDDYVHFYEEQARDINVLTSALIKDCIDKATSYTNGGSRYYGLSLSFNGLSNVADSLSLIKQMVFDEQLMDLAQLISIMDQNWQDEDDVKASIQKKGRFFGNDDDYVDSIAQRIVSSIHDSRAKIKHPFLKNVFFGSFVGATQPNIVLGKKTPATPDGRRKGEAFTMGISQSQGKDKNGMTALLKSIAKLDYSEFCGCIVSNLKMDPRMADTPDKLDRLAQLFHTFLKLGGMQLQINYVSGKDLRKAQECPDAYRQLMVRVTGYSGFFTIFDKDLQEDIIKRTEYHHV